MMPYDYIDGSADLSNVHGLETKENLHLYTTNYSNPDR